MFLFNLKKIAENLPITIGRPLANIPFSLRLGTGYWRAVRAIRHTDELAPDIVENEILIRLRSILEHAIEQIEFYRDFYRKNGFTLDEFQTLKDWAHVPIVTREDLQNVPLESRCARQIKGMKINTGGTSGQPVEFLVDHQAFAREWAHMHYVWKAHGYRPQHLKLTFRGKHFDQSIPLRYNAVHNEYVVNANTPMSQVVDAVMLLPRKAAIRWIHGYPSLVAEFAHALEGQEKHSVGYFRSRLFGVLLGSEYPAPVYRSLIEKILSTNIVSWYGHSEMAVLARETSMGVYESLPTYGYAEAVQKGSSPAHHLICTSLHNHVHPFIRYDTGDLIEPVTQYRGSLAFRISEGREGDFVLDRHGNRHSLTAIIFGRHHVAFELVKHLQVREEGNGRVTLVITPRDSKLDVATIWDGLDLTGLDFEWEVEIVGAPIRTRAGKIQFKIS